MSSSFPNVVTQSPKHNFMSSRPIKGEKAQKLTPKQASFENHIRSTAFERSVIYNY